MKHRVLFFALLLLVMKGLGQTPEISWSKCYGGILDDKAKDVIEKVDGGYVIAGTRDGDFFIFEINPVGDTIWTKNIGGSNADYATSIERTNDNGYVVAGYTSSNDMDVHGNHGETDAWVVKLNYNGDTLWTKCFGGSLGDQIYSTTIFENGNIMLVGNTNSSNGDINIKHDWQDGWIIMLDSVGQMLWNKCFGGDLEDYFYSIAKTADDGYLVVGSTYSSNGDVHRSGADECAWIVKLTDNGDTAWTRAISNSRAASVISNSKNECIIVGSSNGDFLGIKINYNGDILWRREYGGTKYETATSILDSKDGNYIIAGHIVPYMTSAQTDNDALVIQINDAGDSLWSKKIGGTNYDIIEATCTSIDGGIILVGSSNSTDGNISDHLGYVDAWVVRFNIVSGYIDEKTIRCYGGSGNDNVSSISRSIEGGYIIAGSTSSNDGDFQNTGKSDSDVFIMKMTENGDTSWSKRFGGDETEFASKILQNSDGGYIFIASTLSNNNDVHGNHGDIYNEDIWVVKLSSTGDTLWTKCLGGRGKETPSSIINTSDSGYILVGAACSNDGDLVRSERDCYNPAWVVKLKNNGDTAWTKVICLDDFNEWYEANAIISLNDGGYIVTINSRSNGNHKFGIIKFDENGSMIWDKRYGGNGNNHPSSLIATLDGGFFVAGNTTSTDGDVKGNHGGRDAFVMKINKNGEILWSKCYGGLGDDEATSIVSNKDGSYMFSGFTTSSDGFIQNTNGSIDGWLVNFDENGNLHWSKCVGGKAMDMFNDVITMPNGSYIAVGETYSINDDFSANHGWSDIFTYKSFLPLSTTTPLNKTTCKFTPFSISASTSGTKPYCYSLLREGIKIPLKQNSYYKNEIRYNISDVSDYGDYRLIVQNSSESDTSDTFIIGSPPVPKVNPFLISVDEKSQGNEIIWTEKDSVIARYDIYKELWLNKYDKVGFSNYGNFSFVDSTTQKAARYKIYAVDTCGFVTKSDTTHLPMRMTVDRQGNRNVLSWNDYNDQSQQFIQTQYFIFRGTNLSNIVAFDTVSYTTNNYIDTKVNPSTYYYYRVAVKRDTMYAYSNVNGCQTPSVNFSFETACLPNPTSFTIEPGANTYTNTLYEWSFNAGESITTQSLDTLFAFPSTGIYNVVLTAINGNCSSVKSKEIKVYEMPSVSLSLNTDTVICANTEFPLSAQSQLANASYIWSTGASGNSILVSKAGKYFVQAKNAACISYSDTVQISIIEPFQSQEIYLVSVDSISKNNIVSWKKTSGKNIKTYDIYKETVRNSYSLIGSVDADQDRFFIDNSGTSGNSYKIKITDSCNNQSAFSPAHVPIKLVSVTRAESGNTIEWNDYTDASEHFTPIKYYIFRSSDASKYLLLDSVASSITKFIDTKIQPTTFYYYRVGIKRDGIWAYSNSNSCVKPSFTFNANVACFPSESRIGIVNTQNIFDNTTISWSTSTGKSGTLSSVSDSLILAFEAAGLYTVSITANNASCQSTVEKAITVASVPQVNISPASDTSVCMNIPYKLTATCNEAGVTYQWNNGLTAQQINVEATNNYSVVARNQYCSSTSNIIAVEIKKPYSQQELCLVSVDPTVGKNKVMWEKVPDVNTEGYIVYKEKAFNYYEPIGSVDFDSLSYLIDYSSVPEVHGDKYKVQVIDGCGNASEKSPYHKTINLTISKQGNTMGLRWDDYVDEEGIFTPSKYYIYRGRQRTNLEVIDSVSGSFNSYNDQDVTEYFFYMIGAVKDQPCRLDIQNTLPPAPQNEISMVYSNLKSNTEFIAVDSSTCKGLTADFDAPVVCLGDTSNFAGTALGFDLAHATFSWDILNDSTIESTTKTYQHLFTAEGLFPVRLVIKQDSCVSQSVKMVRVNSLPEVTLSAKGDTSVCNDNSFTVTALVNGLAGTNAYTYMWNNGTQSSVLKPYDEGSYSVTVTGGGCSSASKDSVTVQFIKPFDGESICAVTMNLNNGLPTVKWNKTAGKGTIGHVLYRSNSLGLYDEIAEIPFSKPGVFEDQSYKTVMGQVRYKIASVDQCGAKSAKSKYHAPAIIHLECNGSNANLTVDQYDIEDAKTENYSYMLHKGESLNTITPLKPIGGDSTVIESADSKVAFYYVLATIPSLCEPNVCTNIITTEGCVSPTGERAISGTNFVVSPNPFTDFLTIDHLTSDITKIELINASSVIVKQVANIMGSSVTIDTHSVPAGAYFVRLSGDKQMEIKVVKQ